MKKNYDLQKNYSNHFFNRLTFFFIVLLCYTYDVSSQDIDETESPYFSIICPDTSAYNLALMSTNISATISGVIANVELEQLYFNSGDSVIDATYVFPMSTNAAIYKMQMTVDDRVIHAVIKERTEAQEIFEAASDSGYTASLLEQHKPNVFQMSLANINPGDSVAVKMTYTELIEPKDGTYRFLLPSIVGPRYSTDGEEWLLQSYLDLLASAGTELNIELNINAGMSVDANCISHNVPIINNGNSASCYLETNPGSDFIVDYTLSNNQIQTGLLLYEGQDENFFLAMMQPPQPDMIYDSPQREYVFIMDVSGSMYGIPIEISKNLITNLLYDLNSNDKFNIVFFAGGSAVLSPNSLPATTGNIDDAVAMIDNMNAGGGTNLLPAMQTALNMQFTEDYSRTFVILTDGYVTVEPQTFQLIRDNLNEANFFAFGIGNSVNHYLIEGIAYVGEGESFTVTENDNTDTTATRFKEYIEKPVFTNIETSFSGINVYDVEPLSIPDIFAERPVILYGKYDNANSGTITVSGDNANTNVSSTFNFADYTASANENIALKYLWARKKIKLMSDYGLGDDPNDTLTIEEEITQLGLSYNLVTDYTSFVAVDSSGITTANEGSSDDDDDDYGYGNGYPLVDIYTEDLNSDPDIIKISGANLTSGQLLNVTLSDLNINSTENFMISIIDINGAVMIQRKLSVIELETLLTFNIDLLSSATYLLVLSSDNGILDTEKFTVLK